MGSTTSRTRTELRRRGRIIAVGVLVLGATALGASNSGAGVAYETVGHRAPALSREAANTPTRRYLALVASALGAIYRNIGSGYAAMDGLVADVEGHCRLVGRLAPAGVSTWRMEAAIAEEAGTDAAHVDAAVTSRLWHGVEAVKWRDPVITRSIRSTVQAVNRQSHIYVPSLCPLLEEWARGGFRAVPAALAKLNRELELLGGAGDLLPNRLLAATPEPVAVLERIRDLRRLQRRIAEGLDRRIGEVRTEIASAAGLPQLR
jgi:hypothetical protein